MRPKCVHGAIIPWENVGAVQYSTTVAAHVTGATGVRVFVPERARFHMKMNGDHQQSALSPLVQPLSRSIIQEEFLILNNNSINNLIK